VEFKNTGTTNLHVHWVDEATNKEIPQGVLFPGNFVKRDTFLNHKFTISNDQGALIHTWKAAPRTAGEQQVYVQEQLEL